MNPEFNIPLSRWEIFIKLLRSEFINGSENIPTVRVWKRSLLIQQIKSIVKKNVAVLLTTFPPANQVIQHLELLGWIHKIPVEVPVTNPNLAFYLVDMEASTLKETDPLELLQAFLPEGILCYFSALDYYGLTTQIPSHYHIAKAIETPLSILKNLIPKENSSLSEKTTPPSLGQLAFSISGTPCYWTKRQANWIFGVQIRAQSARTWFRITSIEQTLIDTLLQPQRCGGAAVIFEAWNKGILNLSQTKLADHLENIPNNDLKRRVGALHQILSFPLTEPRLIKLLQETKISSNLNQTISLFHGLPTGKLDTEWNVVT